MSKRTEEIAQTVALFRKRSAHWTSMGYTGAKLYAVLAADPELPENLHPLVIATLEGVKLDAVGQRRKRGGGPSFIRTAQNIVIYPTAAYCAFLAARFVERRAAPAAGEYTRAAASAINPTTHKAGAPRASGGRP
jgi:hypothetical protein